MYQVRSHGGLLKEYQDLAEALSHEGGTWEHRTPESLKKESKHVV